MIRSFFITSFVAIVCGTHPLTAQSALVNLYGLIRPGLPNYGVAQGSIFVFGIGTSFGSNTPQNTGWQSVPLQAEFLGVKLDITINGVTTSALPYYVSPETFIAILPSKTPVGDGTLTLTDNGQSLSLPIHVVQSAFGIMTSADRTNNAAVQNASQGGDLVSQINAANPGEYISIWGTGLGPFARDETLYQNPGPPTFDLSVTGIPIEVYIGGVSATIAYHGRTVYPGVDLLNVAVPAGVAGCHVSVVVVAGGVPSNFATIPVASNGRICSDPELIPATSDEYQKLLGLDNVNVAAISLSTLTTFTPPAGATATDAAYAVLQRYPGQHVTSDGLMIQPSIGSCIVINSDLGTPPYFVWSFRQLNAGPHINLNGPAGSLLLVPSPPGYAESPGTSPPIVPSSGGTFTVDNGSGGPDVGPFTTSLSVSLTNPIAWTNRSAITALNHSTDQLITWTGGIPGSYVSIYGYSSAHELSPLNNGNDYYTYFVCSARVSAGQFTVPAAVLGSLIPTGTEFIKRNPAGYGSLYVMNTIPRRFSAPGLDLGLLFFSAGSGISVPFN